MLPIWYSTHVLASSTDVAWSRSWSTKMPPQHFPICACSVLSVIFFYTYFFFIRYLINTFQLLKFPNLPYLFQLIMISISASYRHSLGSRYSDGLSWSSLRKDPSCWGKARWRSVQRTCGCRYCWIDGATRACGSEKVQKKWWASLTELKRLSYSSGCPNSPLHRPLPGPCRMHWEPHRRWCR